MQKTARAAVAVVTATGMAAAAAPGRHAETRLDGQADY